MANKYSRYNLQPYVSQYVNPMSVEVNELLRGRYDENKSGKDLIDRTLAQMEVMEGDKSILETAKQDVRKQLSSIVDQGNYEDATLQIQDAANDVETNTGLLAARKSMENRKLELEFQREARMKGVQILDFGHQASKAHTSYYYDKESESFVTDIYEPLSEQQLDYDKEMRELLVTIKADSDGKGWEGVTQHKADKVAAMIYKNYLVSDAGAQDMRRLMELELPQDLDQETRAQLAKNDIMKRIKGLTRQYVYNKVTAKKGNGTNTNGLIDGILKSGTTSTKGLITNTNPIEQSLGLLDLIKNGDKSDQNIVQELKYQQSLIDQSVDQYIRSQAGTADADKVQETLRVYEELKNSYNQPGDEKYYELVKMLTLNTNRWDTRVGEMVTSAATRGLQGMATGAVVGGSYGAAGGSFVVPGVGTAIGGLGGAGGGALIGGGSAYIGGLGEELTKQLSKFRNVRDWHRSTDDDSLWSGLWDSEQDQLMEELFGGNDGDGNDVSKINEALGTSYTDKDVERLKELALSTHTFMVGTDETLAGDDMYDYIKENGTILTQDGYTAGGSAAGSKIAKQVDNDFRRSSPDDYIFLGAPSKEQREAFYHDEDGKSLWDRAIVTDVYPGKVATNTPTRIQVRIGDQEILMQVKEGSNGDSIVQGGFFSSIADQYGIPEIRNNELMRRHLFSGGRNPSVDEYIDLVAKMQGPETTEEYVAIKRQLSNQMVVRMALDQNKKVPGITWNKGKPYTFAGGKAIPFMNADGTVNPAAFQAWEKSYRSTADSLRKDILSKDLLDAGQIM